MDKPAITVLIDTYNHERFIEEAIVSVLEQDFPASEMEILVVDDGSTDRTPEIVQKFAPRVRYLCKENGGQASAFNFGIPQAQGEIVAFLDGDDWWAKAKLSTVVESFAENPDIGTVGHGYHVTDEAGVLCQTVLPERKYRLNLRSPDEASLFTQLQGFLGTSRMAYRRAILKRALPVPDVLRFEADEFIWTMAVAQADTLVLDAPLFFYRLHAGNHFMGSSRDEARLRRRLDVMQGLLDHVPPGLRSLDVPQEIVDIVTTHTRIETKRLRLILDGGMPWETYSVEQEFLQRAYRSTTLGYRIYKQLSLLVALALPPRRFYQLRDWYAGNNLRRIRGALGEPKPFAPIVELPPQGLVRGERH